MWVFQIMLIILMAIGTHSTLPTCDVELTEIESIIDKIITSLKHSGYEVVEGTMRVYDSNSFGANPGNPYITYFHPGLVESKFPVFSMKEKSAVIFVGCTPSTTSYFSWRSYAMFSRRKLVFASLGDSLNNMIINTTSKTTLAGGKLTSVITTADANVYEDLSNVLTESGVRAVNLDAIPSSLQALDLKEAKFIMLHRASVWGSEQEKQAYFSQTRRILFVNAPKTAKQNSLPIFPLRKRGDGVKESTMPKLKENLDALRSNILSEMESKGYNLFGEIQLYDLGLDGFECLKTGENCKGDNHDTNYLVYHDDSFDQNNVYVIYGTNSVETSKCTYVNIGLYQVHKTSLFNVTKLKSTNLTVDNRAFVGSSEIRGVSDDRVFVFTLRRDGCQDKFCLSVDKTNIPSNTKWALAFRTYLDPATATGPKLDEIVFPKVLKFTSSSST